MSGQPNRGDFYQYHDPLSGLLRSQRDVQEHGRYQDTRYGNDNPAFYDGGPMDPLPDYSTSPVHNDGGGMFPYDSRGPAYADRRSQVIQNSRGGRSDNGDPRMYQSLNPGINFQENDGMYERPSHGTQGNSHVGNNLPERLLSKKDSYGNDFSYRPGDDEPRHQEDDQASVTTLDPTDEKTCGRGTSTLRRRRGTGEPTAAELWQSLKESQLGLASSGLPSRGSAIQRKTLAERRRDNRVLEQADNLTTADYANLMRRDRVITQQNKTGTGIYALKRKSFYKLRLQLNEVSGQLEVWAKSLKVIEGHFGSAILSYFTFVRWLMFLNLFIGLLLFCVITIPYLVLQHGETFTQYVTAVNTTSDPLTAQALECSSNYSQSIANLQKDKNAGDHVIDFLQGTGFMERTVLFYGIYFNKTLMGYRPGSPLPNNPIFSVYNMSLAYLMATGTYFIVSFLLIIRQSAAGVKEGLLSQENSLTKYCNKVFSGWDYCITVQSKAKLKHRNLKKEFQADLYEQQMERERNARRTSDWVKLYVVRLFINVGVLLILGGSLALIYLTNDWSLELRQNEQITEQILVLLVQFLPSITITVLNLIVPLVFDIMVIPEGYSPAFQIKITLSRTVLLRLASIAILMISLYDQVVASTDIGNVARTFNQQLCSATSSARGESEGSDNTTASGLCFTNNTEVRQCGNKDFSKIKCWETYVGQQLYKLVLLDLIVVVAATLLVEFPRKLLYTKFHDKSKLINWLGPQQFDIPRNVLDIVYCQTLCWLGAFFSPLIPFISMLKCFIFFYIKKLSLLQNCDPPEKPFRTSKSNSFFMTVLLISFILTCLPIGYMLGRIPPSQSCGPFRVYSYEDFHMFNTMTNLIETFSPSSRDFFFFFGSVAFYVPAIILLCLLMYYFYAVAQGYKKMSELLKAQLALEGKDKQYLLMRVTEALKRG